MLNILEGIILQSNKGRNTIDNLTGCIFGVSLCMYFLTLSLKLFLALFTNIGLSYLE